MNIKLSINKAENSPFWMVSFIGPDGKQKRRSTKVPIAGGMYQGEKLSPKQAEKRALLVGGKIAEADFAEHYAHNNTPIREFLENYHRRKARSLAIGSIRNNRGAIDSLLKWLGKRANEPLRLFTRADAKEYMEARRRLIRASSLSREIGCLSTAFEDAVDSEIIDRNPWSRLKIPADRGAEKTKAEAFSLEELRFIIANFPPEWSSAVRCSFETYGQRLGDIIRLKWSQFDWVNHVVHFVTEKTGRVLSQPMRPSFYSWAREKYEAEGCNDNAFVHPRLATCTSSVSHEFSMLLDAHGIGTRGEKLDGDRVRMRTKTFHSVRRSAATLLQSSGVAQGIAQKLVGHNSSAIHSAYVRPDSDLLRAAAMQLPEL